MKFSANPREGMTIYAPGYLASLPSLSQGQADDLKVDNGDRRYWLSRCGIEDGEPWQVHVEDLRNGVWVQWLSYREDP